jgi:cell division protein FtsW
VAAAFARTASGAGTSSRSARGLHGVPARIMVPRVVLFVSAFGLTLFGLLMIFSASSATALASESTDYDATYYFIRQLRFVAMGLVLLVVLTRVDYRLWRGVPLRVVWVLTVLVLVAIFSPTAGTDAYGATRWISVAGFTLQPSEFAKVTLVLTGADLYVRFFDEGSVTPARFGALVLAAVGLPLLLILLQPDKGTTGILIFTLLGMGYLAGVNTALVLGCFAAVALGAAVLAMRDSYSRARVLTMLNPFLDPYGSGWQLVQGFYAFGSGGLTGVGIGMSRQKYSYLPMAHNDFIFAVVGEETGFVGAVGVLVAFALLIWAGLRIAEQAPDLRGRLVAAGCSILIGVQLLVNVCGVIGFFPLSGKPVPFLSYGGSSIISCLMLVGLIGSVSLRDELPETVYDRRRGRLRLAGEDEGPLAGTAGWDGGGWGGDARDGGGWDDGRVDPGLSSAGEATPRSSRLRLAGGGGAQGGGRASRAPAGGQRPQTPAGRPAAPARGASGPALAPRPLSPADPRKSGGRGGWRRVGPDADAADRLRVHDDDAPASGGRGRRG